MPSKNIVTAAAHGLRATGNIVRAAFSMPLKMRNFGHESRRRPHFLRAIVSVFESNRHPMNHAKVALGMPFPNTL